MSDAGTYHSRSTRTLAWTFAIGAVLGVVGIAVGLVWVICAGIKAARR